MLTGHLQNSKQIHQQKNLMTKSINEILEYHFQPEMDKYLRVHSMALVVIP